MSLVRMLLGRTPLGWRQLAHAPARFAMAVCGVTFAVLMMFMPLGFMNMLFDSTVMLQRQLNADIVIVNPAARDMINARTIPRRRFVQALGVDGVVDGEPLYVANMTWIKPINGERSTILTIGVSPDFNAFRNSEVNNARSVLATPGNAAFDIASRGDYRAFAARIEAGERPIVEVAGKRVVFDSTFRIGTSFGAEALMFVSEQTFFALQPRATPATPTLALLRITPGQNAEAVVQRINALFDSGDAHAMTVEAYIQRSRDFMARESPIAYIFGFMLIMGISVGIVIVVQILSADVQDHLPEYATFKALGFSNKTMLSIVYEQSTILTVLGFVPGLLASLGLYALIRSALSMPIAMTGDRIVMVFAITAFMCALAGTFALRRVMKADPAEVF
jgi:putative ABC transport system permease protein